MESKNVKTITIGGVKYDLSSSGSSDIDIVDNLETADSESALSANQGKILNEKIETIETETIIGEYDEETGTMKLEFNTPVQGIIEDTLESDNADNALSAKQGKILKEAVDEANAIAKGKNKAKVFATTEAMNTWLSDEANKGLASVGDNLYIVDTDVPDWWISEVLEEANAEGKFYNIAQLETQKVDLSTIEDTIDEINNSLNTKNTYNTNRETLTLTTSNQTITKNGLVYGQITANANSNIIIFVNDIPRTGIRTSVENATPVSMIFSLDVVKGDVVKYGVYNNGTVDSCYLYPKL